MDRAMTVTQDSSLLPVSGEENLTIVDARLSTPRSSLSVSADAAMLAGLPDLRANLNKTLSVINGASDFRPVISPGNFMLMLPPMFLNYQHSFTPFNDHQGGMAAFEQLRVLLTSSSFSNAFPGLLEELSSPSAADEGSFNEITAFIKPYLATDRTKEAGFKKIFVKMLYDKGFITDPYLVSDANLLRIVGFFANEDPQEISFAAFKREIRALNLDRLRSTVTYEQALRIVRFLKEQSLISPAEARGLLEYLEGLMRTYAKVFDKNIPMTDYLNQPVVNNKSVERVEFKAQLWPDVAARDNPELDALNKEQIRLRALIKEGDRSKEGELRTLLNDVQENMERVRIEHKRAQMEEYVFRMDQEILSYNTNSRGIYDIINRALLRMGEQVAPALVESVENLDNVFRIVRLKEGYYLDSQWQLRFKERAQGYAIREIRAWASERELRRLFEERPELMFEVFAYAAKYEAAIDQQILTAIEAVSKDEIAEEKLQAVGKVFFEDFLPLKQKKSHLLLKMYEVGLLAVVLPKLASMNNMFAAYFHGLTPLAHTLFLIYSLESLDQILADDRLSKNIKELPKQVQDNLQKLNMLYRKYQTMEKSSARTSLILAMLLHDVEKSGEGRLQNGILHPTAGANELVPQLVGTFAGLLDDVSDATGAFIRLHQDMYFMADGFPEGKAKAVLAQETQDKGFHYSDLLELVRSLGPRAGANMGDLLFLLTMADKFAVNPDEDIITFLNSKQFNVLNWMQEALAVYYKSDEKKRLAIEQEWTGEAERERQEVVATLERRLSKADVRYVLREEMRMPEKQDELAAILDDPARKQELLKEFFYEIYQPNAAAEVVNYYRRLDSLSIAAQFCRFALVYLAKDEPLPVIHSLLAQVKTGQGKLMEFMAFVNRDRSGLMADLFGFLSAFGVNVVHSVGTTTSQGLVFDRVQGYFQQKVDLVVIWQQMKKHLKERAKADEVRNIDRNIDYHTVMPFIYREIESGRLSMDDFYRFKGLSAESRLSRETDNSKVNAAFVRDVIFPNGKTASVLTFRGPDRTHLAYLLLRRLGGGRFGLNIEQSQKNTYYRGVRNEIVVSKDGRALTEEEKRQISEDLNAFFGQPGAFSLLDIHWRQKKNEEIKTAADVVDNLSMPFTRGPNGQRDRAVKLVKDIVAGKKGTEGLAEGSSFADLRIISLERFAAMVRGEYQDAVQEETVDDRVDDTNVQKQTIKASMDYIGGMLTKIDEWMHTSSLVRSLAKTYRTQLTPLLARPDQLTMQDLGDWQFKLAMLLHADAWLSPSFKDSLTASKGLMQQVVENGYERAALRPVELQHFLRQTLMGQPVSRDAYVYRNVPSALAAVLNELLPRHKGGRIRISPDLPADIHEAVRFKALQEGLSVLDGDMEQEIGDSDLFILSLEQMKDKDLAGRLEQKAAASRRSKVNIIYLANEAFEPKGQIAGKMGIYGIYDLQPLYGQTGAFLSFIEREEWRDNDSLYTFQTYGGLMDGFANYRLYLSAMGRLPEQNISTDDEPELISLSKSGDRKETLRRMRDVFDALSRKLVASKDEGREMHAMRSIVMNRMRDLDDLQASAPEQDVLTAAESALVRDMERDHHAILRFLGYLGFLSAAEPVVGVEEGLERQLNENRYLPSSYHQRTVLYQSGMASLVALLDLMASRGPGGQYLSGTDLYFETEHLKGEKNGAIKPVLVQGRQIDEIVSLVATGQYRGYLMEPIGNTFYARSTKAHQINYPAFDIKRLVAGLARLEYKEPFYLVIDDSVLGPALKDDSYLQGVNIPENLIIVRTRSLQKLYEEGQELSSAGSVTAIGSSKERIDQVNEDLKKTRRINGSGLSPVQLHLLATIGFEGSLIEQRTARINANAMALASYLDTKRKAGADIQVHYPGLEDHPDHKIARENYASFGPYVVVRLPTYNQERVFTRYLQRRLAEQGVVAPLRDSFGFSHVSLNMLYGEKGLRISLGEQGEAGLQAIFKAFDAALEDVGVADSAMQAAVDSTVGGIDLTPQGFDLQVKGSSDKIVFNLDERQLAFFEKLPGFMPVVVGIRPMKDLPQFLGITIEAP